MGQVNYKSDYAAFAASAEHATDDVYIGDAIESTGKCLRPRMRITGVMVGALLLSIAAHAAFTLSIALAPSAVPARIVERDIFAGSPRVVVHLDWDQYANAQDKGSAADLNAETTAVKPPSEPQQVAAAAVTSKEDSAPYRDTKSPLDPPQVDKDEPEAQPTPSLESLSQTDRTRIQLPSDAHGGAANDNAEEHELGSAGAGSGTGTRDTTGIARGPHRREGSSGDGTGQDVGALRRGHIAQLNRAIRSKNPCTRKLSHHGLSGDVVLGLTQSSDGHVDEVRVLRSSGEPLIDDAAKAFVRDQRGLPAPDASLTGDVWKIGLRFKCDV